MKSVLQFATRYPFPFVILATVFVDCDGGDGRLAGFLGAAHADG